MHILPVLHIQTHRRIYGHHKCRFHHTAIHNIPGDTLVYMSVQYRLEQNKWEFNKDIGFLYVKHIAIA